jgi:hypothetical protein
MANNNGIYLSFILLALLSGLEPLELTTPALRASRAMNVFCSAERFRPLQKLNRTFVRSGVVFWDVRDSSLNGICSPGTIAFVNISEGSDTPRPDARCNFTATLSDDLCASEYVLALSLLQLEEELGSVSPNSWECVRGEGKNVAVCEDYNSAQATCVQSASDRFTALSIIGVIGILLYPVFFGAFPSSSCRCYFPYCKAYLWKPIASRTRVHFTH